MCSSSFRLLRKVWVSSLFYLILFKYLNLCEDESISSLKALIRSWNPSSTTPAVLREIAWTDVSKFVDTASIQVSLHSSIPSSQLNSIHSSLPTISPQYLIVSPQYLTHFHPFFITYRIPKVCLYSFANLSYLQEHIPQSVRLSWTQLEELAGGRLITPHPSQPSIPPALQRQGLSTSEVAGRANPWFQIHESEVRDSLFTL